MKKIILPLALVCLTSIAHAQNTIRPFTANNVDMNIHSDGSIEELNINWDTRTSFMWVHQVWASGIDPVTQDLHLSAVQYRQAGTDYNRGPVSSDPNATNFYNKVWVMSKAMVDSFRQGLYTSIPQEIIDWPGNGRAQFGEAEKLAPYVDVNGDGVYDPQDGDYPCIKGDKAAFFMFNDKKTNRKLNGKALEIEFHGMLYSFEDEAQAEDCFFISYNVYNRSQTDYDDFRLAVFSDFDIGNPIDDLVGTDIENAMAYMYNAEPIDDGPIGFGAYPPAAGMMVLKGPPANPFDGIDNSMDGCIDGIRDASGNCIAEDPAEGIVEDWRLSSVIQFAGQFNNSNVTLSTTEAEDFNNFMHGKYRNGNPISFQSAGGFLSSNNGNGFLVNPSAGTLMPVVFPGNTYDIHGTSIHIDTAINWFQSPVNLADHRTLTGLGNSTFASEASFQFEIAYLIARDTVNNDRSISALQSKAAAVRSFHNGYQNECVTTPNFSVRKQAVAKDGLKMYPNPAHTSAVIEVKAEKYGSMQVRVFDMKGALVQDGSHTITPGTQEVELHVGSLKNGIYTVQVLVDGKMYNQKLSVQR